MTRLGLRVAKIEKRCGASHEVVRIVNIVRRASDEELHRLTKSGRLARMGERLSERELDQLISELRAMQAELRESS
jgi:hypothetical protein